MNLRQELAVEISAERFDVTDQGIYFHRQGVLAKGEYFDRVNRRGPWMRHPNRLPVEGLAHILNVALGTIAKPAGHYLALFSGSTAPAANWTAASFAAVANEIVSQTEGYAAATRPVWTPANTSTSSIDNLAAVASLTIATASQLNVTGAAMLTNSTRGGTTGALVSASLYAAPRVFQNGDIYELGYRINLTV